MEPVRRIALSITRILKEKRGTLTVSAFFLGFFLAAGVLALSSCSMGGSDSTTYYTVSFSSNGGTAVTSQRIEEGEKAVQPSSPTYSGYVFDAWYSDAGLTTAYDFTAAVNRDITLYAKWLTETDQAVKYIKYKGTTVYLSDHAYYVDASLTDAQRGSYNFTSLTSMVSGVSDIGTEADPVVVYLAADVYWTDDYTSTDIRASNDLVGLSITQSYITLRGMTGDPEDVVIASDRGQNAGANGNFNTLGVSNGFHAYDITFGNYCNVDLVYPSDTSKNHTKRQNAVTQAQVICEATSGTMDELYFEDCRIVSRLNLLALGGSNLNRTYFKNCHLECTDDSLPTGYISVFEGCDFDLYSNTPCYTTPSYLLSFLGCTFNTTLSDNKVLTFSKYDSNFAFIDCAFKGDLTGVNYRQDTVYPYTRVVVYNDTINGEPLSFNTANTNTSVTADAAMLTAFKVGNEYNIYNLLNNAGSSGTWDPAGQAAEMASYVAPWKVLVSGTASTIVGDKTDSSTLTATVCGGSGSDTVTWSVPDDGALTLSATTGSSVTVTAAAGSSILSETVTATMPNGLKGAYVIEVTPATTGTAAFTTVPSLGSIVDGTITVSYVVHNDGQEITSDNPDESVISWYRSSDVAGTDKVKVATSRYVEDDAKPYATYVLGMGDVGYYLICEVTPQLRYSNAGTAVSAATTAAVTSGDLKSEYLKKISADFEHLVCVQAENDSAANNYEWTTTLTPGFWYAGAYLPVEYRTGGSLAAKTYTISDGTPWTYGVGINGAAAVYGFLNTQRGARMVYPQSGSYGSMTLTAVVAPEKTAGQGFGSAGQFMDVYIKYDPATLTGYGLRISREASTTDTNYTDYLAKSCYYQLMSYTNGVATALGTGMFSSGYLADCTIVVSYTDSTKLLSAQVSTTAAQDSAYPSYMAHSVDLSYTLTDGGNTNGGFGVLHTGTTSNGNRTSFETLTVEY